MQACGSKSCSCPSILMMLMSLHVPLSVCCVVGAMRDKASELVCDHPYLGAKKTVNHLPETNGHSHG